MKARCRVRRFRKNENGDIGHLVRKLSESRAFHHDIRSDEEDDESGYRFGDHIFRVGEYVSVREDDEIMPYQVKTVSEASVSANRAPKSAVFHS